MTDLYDPFEEYWVAHGGEVKDAGTLEDVADCYHSEERARVVASAPEALRVLRALLKLSPGDPLMGLQGQAHFVLKRLKQPPKDLL